MRLNLILLVISLTGLVLPGMSYALEQPVSDTLALRIYFRQGYAAPESDYRENGVRMEAFATALKTIQEDPTRRLKTIHVAAGCSPEGTTAANRRLSAKRVSNVAAYLRSHLALPDSLVQERSLGIDWQGLIELVEVSDMRHRDEVLALCAIPLNGSFATDRSWTGACAAWACCTAGAPIGICTNISSPNCAIRASLSSA